MTLSEAMSYPTRMIYFLPMLSGMLPQHLTKSRKKGAVPKDSSLFRFFGVLLLSPE